MDTYRFERLTDANLKDLLFLYKEAFNEIESLSFLQKKYNTDFAGVKNIGFIAYEAINHSPVAYYGVFPVLLEFKQQQIIAAQSGDTMTHPNHRGKGLFITLAKMTYDLAKEVGIELVFGFPNANSYPGFVKKLSWQHYSNVNHYKLKASVIPFDKLVKRFSFLKPMQQILLPSSLPISPSEQFPNSIMLQNPLQGGVSHHLAFFAYKTYYPSFVINICGVKCWVKIDGRLWVGDIEFCKEEKFNEVVDALVVYAKKKLCATVQFSFFEGSLYDQWMAKRSMVDSTIAVGALNLSMKFDPTQFAYQASDFDTF